MRRSAGLYATYYGMTGAEGFEARVPNAAGTAGVILEGRSTLLLGFLPQDAREEWRIVARSAIAALVERHAADALPSGSGP